MKKHRKRKSASEKLEVLNYYELHGATKASREFNVSVGSIYKWKEAYEADGIKGFSKGAKGKASDSSVEENRRLKRENDELKKMVAEKELEIRIKNEMLKKST
ncbi:MAG: transposase [Saprospiraceae bacterium]